MSTKHILIGIAAVAILVFIIYNAQQRKKNAPIYIRKTLVKNYNARTIPPLGIYIKASEKNNEALLRHELAHWKQYQKKGLFNYYANYIKQLVKYGYDKMPMEQEARENESEYCKQNYTECVRTGQSNTIYDIDFRS
ncbi:hypothetical protein JYU20_00415 [Bacteroidales bacterium AH-315-I05]|nr:hypothetical protein [Bacteroidales bacterium AH-315-I05]